MSSLSLGPHLLRTAVLATFVGGCGRIGLELDDIHIGVAADSGPDVWTADSGVESDAGGSESEASICATGTCGCDVTPPPGLLAHFALDEGSGSVAADSVGGLTGTLESMSADAWVTGQLEGALAFDGVDDHVTVGPVAGAVRALSFWLKPDSFGVTTDQTGFRSPSSTGSPNDDWSNPTRAYTKDGSSASVLVTILSSRSQDWGGFNFSVPSPATGIEVKVDSGGLGLLSGTGVELSWNAGASYSNAGYGGASLVDLGSNVTTFGGPTQLWGRAAWSEGELSNQQFRVRVRAGGLLGTASIDHLEVNVHYQPYTANRAVLSLNDSTFLELDGAQLSTRGFPAGTRVYVDGSEGTTIDTDFHHVVVVSPSDVEVTDLTVGAHAGSLTFEGVLDDLKVFDAEQSEDDVRTLFEHPSCGV